MRRWRPGQRIVSCRLLFGCFEGQDSQAIPLYKSVLAGRGENFVLSSLETVMLIKKRGSRVAGQHVVKREDRLFFSQNS